MRDDLTYMVQAFSWRCIPLAFTIGVDYGTQSGRVVLLDLESGQEVAVSVVPYRHGVIDDILPSTEERLPVDFALQHPQDYLDVLHQGIPDVLRKSQISGQAVVGIGIDFTSCTVIPVNAEGTPLCLLPQWCNRKHAWPKLWKHHSAQRIADKINAVALEQKEAFLSRYGYRVSSEWYFPKVIEVFEEDRAVYDTMARFIEATDWIVWYLTGSEKRNSCTAGYKAMWSPEDGLPSPEFFSRVSPGFTNPGEKLGDVFYPLGTKAGNLTAEVSERLGLSTKVAVAVGNVDAMVSVPSVGVRTPGSLVMVMGTSICHLTVTEDEVRMPGITGVVKDGVLPGLYGYEAGQAAVGDMFEWFVKQSVPSLYYEQAASKGVSIHELLERQASTLKPGETGLIAFDWWNGNRSILGDADVSGLIVGLTLATEPHEIYRALLESTAFGTRRIVDNFAEHGVLIKELVACGGIAQKNELLMQIYADVCGLPVTVRSSTEVPARGAAMFGAVAAGRSMGGFDTIEEASERLAPSVIKIYTPDQKAHAVYSDIYGVYREMYEVMGQEKVDWMHRLKSIRVKTV